jgi:tRNA threonylcarbamoyladenosine biosynthesis protein TsaE
MKITTRDAQETESLGAALGGILRAGDVVVLTGDLGAGKTTFAKGIARALGIQEPVTSPTFTIVQEYDGGLPVAHVDVYRLERVQELHDLGFEELLDGRVVLIEWGERVAPALPRERVDVTLEPGPDEDARIIEIVGRGAPAARVDTMDAHASARD